MVPAVGFVSPRIVRPAVVFPHPLSPTRPTVSPRGMSRSIPSTARTAPTSRRRRPPRIGKYLRRRRTSTRGSATGPASRHRGDEGLLVQQARREVPGLHLERGRLPRLQNPDDDVVRLLALRIPGPRGL